MEQPLSRWLSFIESAYLEYSSGDVAKAKKSCMSAVKILNSQVNLKGSEELKEISAYSLMVYDQIVKSKLSVSDQIKWLASKYPPKLTFRETNSMDDRFNCDVYEEDDVKIRQLPSNMPATFKPVTINDWTSTREDLQNLYQDLLPNCSFVSSLLSITANQPLIDLITPKTTSNCYRVQLYLNGCWRIVTIDNQLPLLDEQRNIIIRSYTNHQVLWPALIEKAYLKVMGQGYEFGGSNMSNDTYMLTGWLPETLKINNHTLPTNFDQLWSLKERGELLMGIGTGKISQEVANSLGLIPNHDYVVEDYDKQQQELVVKNPWIEGNNMQNRYLKLDANFGFNFLYLNWNINKFKYHYQVNLVSPQTTQLRDQSQFALVNNEDFPIETFILVERHLSSEDMAMKIDIYETKGDKIVYPNQYAGKSTNQPSNSRLQLVKLTLPPQSTHTIVVLTTLKSTLTLNIYNDLKSDLKCTRAKNLYPNLESIDGGWTHQTNGGNWALTSYIINPQYSIEILQQTNVLISIFTDDISSVVNLHLLHCDGAEKNLPIRLFDKSKLILNENYQQSYQAYKVNLTPGHYKLIISSYDRLTIDQFKLLVNYSGEANNLQISKISNHLGLFAASYQFEWNNGNRHKLRVSTLKHNTKATFHIHLPHSNYDMTSTYVPAIRGLIFQEVNSQPLFINETWNNSIYGVFVDCIFDTPNVYILLVERFETGNGTFVIDIGSDKKIELL